VGSVDLATYRAYDPDLGRWLSRDPIAENGGVNLYAYVDGQPNGRVDPQGLTWKSNWNFFWSWALGTGRTNRSYGPGSVQSNEMRDSIPGAKLREMFYDNECNDFANGNYGTGEAYLDTIVNPMTLDWSDTSTQVGGFSGATATNNGDGTVTFTVKNDAGAHSFFLHAVPNVPDHITLTIPRPIAFTVRDRTLVTHLIIIPGTIWARFASRPKAPAQLSALDMIMILTDARPPFLEQLQRI